MFEKNEALDAALEQAINYASGLHRGELVPHAKLQEFFGCQRYEGCWSTAIAKLRREFLKRAGILLFQRPGDRAIGYRLATHDEQLTVAPLLRAKRAARQCNRAVREVEATPIGELSHHQKKVRGAMIDQMIAARRAVKRRARESRLIFSATPVRPRAGAA